MPRFFTDALRFDTNTETGQAVLDGEDGRHIARSLRMHIGEAITVSDGAGFDYDGEIADISGDTVTVDLTKQYKNKSEPTLRVTLYPGMPKGDKLELVTQKATEMGAVNITPVLTDRSVSRPDGKSAAKKQERLQRIALEAAKQSGRGAVPEVGVMTSFKEAVRNAKGTKILFYEGGGLPLSACLPEKCCRQYPRPSPWCGRSSRSCLSTSPRLRSGRRRRGRAGFPRTRERHPGTPGSPGPCP